MNKTLIYIVTVNGKVSQEAYKTYEEAARFVMGRIENKAPHLLLDDEWQGGNYGYMTIEHKGNVYQIHDVRVS